MSVRYREYCMHAHLSPYPSCTPLQPFLGAVTYGPSGVEFTATGCFVSSDHVAITCVTVPGTGRKLKWAVNVGGQLSTLSTATSSYASPNITSVAPSIGLSNGVRSYNVTCFRTLRLIAFRSRGTGICRYYYGERFWLGLRSFSAPYQNQ